MNERNHGMKWINEIMEWNEWKKSWNEMNQWNDWKKWWEEMIERNDWMKWWKEMMERNDWIIAVYVIFSSFIAPRVSIMLYLAMRGTRRKIWELLLCGLRGSFRGPINCCTMKGWRQLLSGKLFSIHWEPEIKCRFFPFYQTKPVFPASGNGFKPIDDDAVFYLCRLIFSDRIAVLGVVEELLQSIHKEKHKLNDDRTIVFKAKDNYLKMDGSTAMDRRQEMIDKFNNDPK